MTRRSKRELERALEGLTESEVSTDRGSFTVVRRDTHTGEITTLDGDVVDVAPDENTVVINETVVMMRDRAEEEGREILGPADVAAAGNDAVRVARRQSNA